jgi:DNA-binding transcriptional MerR regulator
MAKKREPKSEFEEFEIDPNAPVFTTGVVCKLLDIPIWVLKQLDEEGIVCPPRESEGQARLYSQKEVKKVHKCWFYIRVHKVKIPGLKVILRMEKKTGK